MTTSSVAAAAVTNATSPPPSSIVTHDRDRRAEHARDEERVPLDQAVQAEEHVAEDVQRDLQGGRDRRDRHRGGESRARAPKTPRRRGDDEADRDDGRRAGPRSRGSAMFVATMRLVSSGLGLCATKRAVAGPTPRSSSLQVADRRQHDRPRAQRVAAELRVDVRQQRDEEQDRRGERGVVREDAPARIAPRAHGHGDVRLGGVRIARSRAASLPRGSSAPPQGARPRPVLSISPTAPFLGEQCRRASPRSTSGIP